MPPLKLLYWSAVRTNWMIRSRCKFHHPSFQPTWQQFLMLWESNLYDQVEHPFPSFPKSETQLFLHSLDSLQDPNSLQSGNYVYAMLKCADKPLLICPNSLLVVDGVHSNGIGANGQDHPAQ